MAVAPVLGQSRGMASDVASVMASVVALHGHDGRLQVSVSVETEYQWQASG